MLDFKKNGERCQKILLINEVDLLFDLRYYYGDTFNLTIDLSDLTIIQLFQFIWSNKDNSLDYDKILVSK